MNNKKRRYILFYAYAPLEFIFWWWTKYVFTLKKLECLKQSLRLYIKAWNDK